MFRVTLLALLAPTFALAQGTIDVPYEGRMLDSTGGPVSTIANVTFSLYGAKDPSSDQTALWSVTQSLGLSDGFYSTLLPLPVQLFDGTDRYLELSVGGQHLLPRLKVGWAPLAAYAALCKNVVGSSVATAMLRVNGAQPVAGTGRLSGLPSNNSLTGNATAFIREVEPGDLLTVDPSTDGGVPYRVVRVASDTEVIVVPSVGSGFLNSAFTVQKALTRMENAAGQAAFTVAATGDVGIGTVTPGATLHVAGTSYLGGVRVQSDQGGSLELGIPVDATLVHDVKNPIDGGVPYIDFHFGNGKVEDYNTRIINDADGHLAIVAKTVSTGAITAESFNGLAIWEKGGNNGSVSCDEFCAGPQWWSRTGTCISAKRLSDGAGIACGTVAGTSAGVRCICSSF